MSAQANDLRFSDAGGYGAEIPTPNLDRLAALGVRVTQLVVHEVGIATPFIAR